MSPEICEHHIGLANNIAVMANDVAYIRKTVCRHIDEGEKEGGHRDILRENTKDIAYLKKQISEIKRSKWQSGAIGGVVVFTLTKSPEIGHMVLTFITKMVFAGQ